MNDAPKPAETVPGPAQAVPAPAPRPAASGSAPGQAAPGQPAPGQAAPDAAPARPVEIGGPKGPEPTRYGDWEINGRCVDF